MKDPRWDKVQSREASADGEFVYAVTTTGIYCVASCPSRRPRRENVEFFATASEAEGAGFRACLRCRPEGAARRVALVAKACEYIASRPTATPTLESIAACVGASPSHLHRLFRKHLGQTPREYAAGLRSARMRGALEQGKGVTEAIYEAGYGSSGRFYEQSDAALGMTPSKYKNQGRGVWIQSTLGETSLGTALVAASERGICAVSMGDDPEALVAELRERFRNAEFLPSDEAFEVLVAKVLAAIDGDQSESLPLDIRGTAFQHRVWRALNEIPRGTTASYTDIAKAIGQPKAFRAVARACATNELAILVPCHRVLRSDGSLGGYRWGIKRKKLILEREFRQ